MSTNTDRTTIALAIPRLGRAGWVAIGLVAGLLAAQVAGPALAPRNLLATDPTGASEHTISVTGTGRVVITPDTADLRLGVSTAAKTVKEARAAAASSMTAVIASLKNTGIADRDIQTTILSLQPTYDYATGGTPPRLTGYSLTNAVAVTVRNLDLLGPAIDAALAAGATTMDGVSFRVADQTTAEKQARTAAMAEAKAKASALASAAGVSISGISTISETVAPVPYPVYFGAAAGVAKDMATPVQPGTSEITISVAVVYLIG